MERLYILDGSGYAYRAHYGLATGGRDRQGVRLTTSDGTPTGALYVYAQMLVRLYLDEAPERIVVVFDAPGKSFRAELDDQYKATRSAMPDDLKLQMPQFAPLTEALSWPVVSVAGVEADDVIATMTVQAREAGLDVTILSADKDLMQLVDAHVVQVDPMRNRRYDEAGVFEKFGVRPGLVADWLSLVGDASDNIPGMAGVGKVTATKLLTQYGSLDGILANTSELKGKMKERFEDPAQIERLSLSRKLVELKCDVELPQPVGDLVPANWDGAGLAEKFRELEFYGLLERLDPGAEMPAAPAAAEVVCASSWSDTAAMLAAAKKSGVLAMSVETDGARPDRSRVIGIGLAAEGTPPVYLPIAHRYLSVPPQLSLADAPAAWKELIGSGTRLVFHDGKTACKALRRAGVDIAKPAGDVMLAAYLADSSSDGYALEGVAKNYLGRDIEGRRKLVGSGKNSIGFEVAPVEAAANYSGSRALSVLDVAPVLGRRLDAIGEGELYRDVEIPLSALLGEIEDTGICIDTDYLRVLAEQASGRIVEIERSAYEQAGEQFNLASPKQLSALLFEKLGLRAERMKKTRTGAFSTDAEVLDSMRGMHPIIELILDHRELTKLKGTYIDALPPLISPATGRLHTNFRQAVTATGRLSSQDPNLQNIPIRTDLGKQIRRAFIPAEGMALLSADYSQIELRVMAHLSKDPVLCRAFMDGVDVHTQTAAEVFGLDVEAVTTKERRVAKAVNYGLIYGQSDFGLGRALDIPRHEARHYIDRYFERFAKVRQFMDTIVEKARKIGAAHTILGRRRPIPELSSKNQRLRSQAERIAQNTPVQGSAADIMKVAMLRVADAMKTLDYNARFLLTVHDELVFEVEIARADDFAAVVKREMEGAYMLDVPLVVDVGIGANWAEAH